MGHKKIMHRSVQCRNRQWDVLCEVTRVCIRCAPRTSPSQTLRQSSKKIMSASLMLSLQLNSQHLVWITPGEGTSIQYVYFVPDVFL